MVGIVRTIQILPSKFVACTFNRKFGDGGKMLYVSIIRVARVCHVGHVTTPRLQLEYFRKLPQIYPSISPVTIPPLIATSVLNTGTSSSSCQYKIARMSSEHVSSPSGPDLPFLSVAQKRSKNCSNPTAKREARASFLVWLLLSARTSAPLLSS